MLSLNMCIIDNMSLDMFNIDNVNIFKIWFLENVVKEWCIIFLLDYVLFCLFW